MDKENKLMELERELKSEENEHKRLHLLLSIAEVNWQKGEYSLCRKSAEKASIFARQLNNEEYLARSYYLIGLANNYLNLYDEALEYHHKALQINKKLGLSSVVAEGLNNIGQIYLNITDFDKAEEYFKKSIEFNPEFARGYNNLGVVGIRREKFEEALEYMLKGLDLLEKSDFPDKKRSRVISMINIAQIYLRLDEFEKALQYAESAQDLSKSQNNDTRIFGIMNYSTILLDLKYFERAKKQLLEALELAKKQENRETLKEIYYLLSHTCENQNDSDSSLYFLKKHIEL